ncbi:MAG: tRNA 2-thiocytidine biosynthesis TtcA family protein [Bacillota bacterium]|nr:tRNA 2-thiocytidine biosynthesis TtcA family protein [Bacillota bacterium]
MRKILGCVKRAQAEFNMIEDGDVVGVGVSGGKDSMVLLYALCLFRNFAPVKYELKALTVDMGFPGFDVSEIREFCSKHDIEFIHIKTGMGKLIFEERREKNPCSFCSKMRRGLLNKVCESRGITKLALGHHGDDLIETLLMSMLYESRLNTFKPMTEFERTSVVQIRPLIYACEKDAAEAASRHKLPVVTNPCPASGNTRRETAKELVNLMEIKTGQPRSHMINALCKRSPAE